jgi:hypothetical protein
LDIITDDTPALDMDIDALMGDMDVNHLAFLKLPELRRLQFSMTMDDVLDEIPDEDEIRRLP